MEQQSPSKRTGVSPSTIALVFFVAAAGYFLWTEHRAHVIQFLPWIIFLMCPLMHVFMHGGHGGGHGGHHDEESHSRRKDDDQ